MNLKDLILLLNSDERIAFITFLHSRNKRKSTRNIDLFEAYVLGKEEKIKTEIGANAFGVLKKRLKDALVDFLGSHRLWKEEQEGVEIYQYMTIGKRLIEERKYKSGYNLLRKAEKLALTEEHWTYLNELYHIYIEYSSSPGSPSLEVLMEKHQHNQKRFIQQENLNLAYAMIKRKFLESEFEGENQDMETVIANVYAQFQISDEMGYSLKSLYQLSQIADIYGATTLNYHKSDQFFADHINALKVDNKARSWKLKYQFDLYYSIANVYFRKRDFEKCGFYIDILNQLLLGFKGKAFKSNQLRLQMLKALNLNYSGAYLEALKELEGVQGSDDLSFILIRSMIWFQQGELRKTKTELASLQRSDRYYINQKGVEMVMRKNMIEILLYFDLNDPDYVESRMKSFHRKFKAEMNQPKYENVKSFLNLISVLNENPELKSDDDFLEKVELSINWKSAEEEDIFFISFYAWLKSKMLGTDLYQQTLELI